MVVKVDLALGSAGFLLAVFFVQQMGNASQLFGCGLQSFNLFSQLCLLGLLLAQDLVNVFHRITPKGQCRWAAPDRSIKPAACRLRP